MEILLYMKIILALSFSILLIGGYFYSSQNSKQQNEAISRGYLSQSYKDLNPLMTDFYQLTMSSVFYETGRKDEEATFYMYWRKPPFKGGYTLAVGLEGVVDFLKNFRFDAESIAYLETLKDKNGRPMFKKDFLAYLRNVKLDVTVDAVPEGTAMIGQGPVVRVSGPLIQCQLIESAILNIMNANSIVATRAARIASILLKHDASCAYFSLRRAPALDLSVPRSAYIGGVLATANIDAGMKLGIPIVGTMAHSFVTSFQQKGLSNSDVERLAFRTYLKAMPGNSVLLVDTFNAKQGIINAIEVSIELKNPLNGVRLDSGDLYELSWFAYEKIEQAKKEHPELFKDTQIFLTDGLDEKKIEEFFKRSQAEKGTEFPAKRYGVGTNLGNPGPLSGGVYKLSAFRANANQPMTPTMKIAGRKEGQKGLLGEKSSLPGEKLDTLRLLNADGKIVAEVVVDTSLMHDGLPEVDALLKSRKAIRLNGGEETLEELPEFKTSTLLLQPVFKRQDGGKPSIFVNNESVASQNNKLVELKSINAYAQQQMASMPEEIKKLSEHGKLPLFISPGIYENIKKIAEKNDK